MAGFNAFDTFNSARQASYDGLNQVRQDRGRMDAGRALQGGDYRGAAGALYGAGDLQAGMAVQQGQEHQQDRQMEMAQQQQKLAAQQAAQKAEQMKRMALALQSVPQEQRAQVFHSQVGPALVQLGMNPQDLNGVENHLDDASLATFAGEMDKHIQVINRGGGGYDILDTSSGKITRGPEPTQKPPVGYMFAPDGSLMVDPGYVAGQGQIANVRAAATAAHRAPPRGGGGGAGKPKPWERKF